MSVWIIPNSSRTDIANLCDDLLKIKIMERLDENRANEALIKFLSKKLKIKTISIVSGMRIRNEVIDFGNDFILE
ncbi:MAG: DUF167 domain-containing protein [Puniceicoccales bacterium]|jgi:uncharacterized protein YggU (UPF0235/DUF167 family)|nr:DUF167 domain-containing protein [Puniceicoccales bacterium]